ncbi:MAG TPA: lipopolysaccharide biosynthesis protein [Xanthobacteraceae bacterium]
MSSAKQGMIWSAVNTWTNNVLSLAVVTLLARLVSPNEFGLVALAGIYVAFGQVFISDTVSEALVQRNLLDPAHLDAAFWVMALLGVVATVAGVAGAPLLGAVFSEPAVVPILQIISLRLLFDSLMTVPTALLLRRLDFRSLAKRSLVANIAGGAAGVGIALAGGGAWALVAQQLVNAAATLAVLSANAGWFPRLTFSRAHARDLIAYSSFTGLSRLGYFLVNNVDRILIGFFVTSAALGVYSLAKRVTEMMHASITGVVVAVAHPHFAREQNDIGRLREALTAMMDKTVLVAFPAFFGLAAIGTDVVPLVFGAKWDAAVPVLQVLSILMALYAVSTLHGALVRAMGRAGWWSGFVNLTSALYVVGFVVAGPHGIVAVAASSLAMFALVTPLHFWMVARLLGLRLARYVALFVAPLVASAAMSLLIVLLRERGYFPAASLFGRVAAEIAVGMTAYAVLIIVLAPGRTRWLIAPFRRSAAAP